jgi:predicted nucleic acid-binding protein
MIILDTNVLSAAMRREPVVISWLDEQARTSVWTTTITVFEIRFGLAILPAGRRQTERQTAFELALAEKLDGRVLPFDERAAEEAASLMATRYQTGKPRELRDSMIAGIALAQRATLVTRNVHHFDDLSVPVIDPWRA